MKQSAVEKITSSDHRVCKRIRKGLRPRSGGEMIDDRNISSRCFAVFPAQKISFYQLDR